MSAQKFADNPTVRHPTPTTKLSASARVVAAESRAEQEAKKTPTAANERRVAAVADRFCAKGVQ